MKSLLLVFCLFLSNPSAMQANQKPAPKPPAPSSVPADFVIGLEDVLSINVWKEPELSVKEVIVRPDGKISLPLVGDIQASGLTPKQLQGQISERMKEFVAAPNVTIVVL